MLSNKINIEMRVKSAKSVFKKIAMGVLAIFMVGLIAFILLFLVMVIM